MAYTSSHGNVGHGHGYEDEEDRNQSRDRMTFGLLAELAERLTCGFTCGSRQESFMREETPGSSVMGVSGRGGVMQPGQENVHPMEFGRPGHFVRSSVQSGNGLGGRAVAYDGSVTSRQVSSLMTPGAPCLKGGGVGGGGGGTLGGEAKGILRSRASTMVPEDDAPLVTMGRGDFEGTGRWGADGGGTERRGRTQRGSVSSVDDWSLDGESEMASLRAQHAQREAEEFRRRELERYYQSRLEFAHTDPVVKYEASILHAASSNLREKTILRTAQASAAIAEERKTRSPHKTVTTKTQAVKTGKVTRALNKQESERVKVTDQLMVGLSKREADRRGRAMSDGMSLGR